MKEEDINEFLKILDAEDIGGGNYEKRASERRECNIKALFVSRGRDGTWNEDKSKNSNNTCFVNISKTGVALVTGITFYVGDEVHCQTLDSKINIVTSLEIIHFKRVEKGLFQYGCKFKKVTKS